MNKTVSVNINGLIFNIEEQAFEKLNNYLDRIRKYLNNSEGADEVIADIEARIGELFLENINDRKEVINSDDVEKVIRIMGRPEDYIGEDSEEPVETTYTKKGRKRRRLFRDPDNQLIGGVCAGLSNYFGWDPVWLRIILILLFVFGGFGFVAYIILWIVIPKAETTAEKIMMHGEPVTVENIKKVVDEGIDALLGKGENHSSRSARAQNVKNGFSRFFGGIMSIFFSIFRFIGKIIGAVFLIGAMIALVALSIALFDPEVFAWHDNGLNVFSLKDAKDLFIGDSSISSLMTLGIVMLVFSPLIALIYLGLKLVFKIKSNSKMIGGSLLIMFMTGMGLTIYSGLKVNSLHKRSETIEQFEDLEWNGNSLKLMSNTHTEEYRNFRRNGLIGLDEENVSFGHVEFTILKSTQDSIVQLQIRKSSNGFDSRDAKERIENITYNWSQNNDKVIFDSHMEFKRSDLIRNQEVDLILRLPVGKSVFLDRSMRRIIHDIPNNLNMWDGDMIGHYWIMTETGLECMDCEEEKDPEVNPGEFEDEELEIEEFDIEESEDQESDVEDLAPEGINEGEGEEGAEGSGEKDGGK
ncbi:MAG: PspC domain-containing protein [Bacteroidota bacterium]